ncbi:RDD family protein [Chitinophaga sedimenti]|uniref:RDD family protein n=1 Tax=Chitinophaga sedimenti TaxID=2033606 RepID=UPI00200616E6|nr:RDD family protein [Chitinophaga sedimenti]MCK7558356.1 RDD family protein [Chitinophaga sedimenti]
MTSIKIPTVFNIDLEFEAADMGRRLLAYIIDLFIRVAYILLLNFAIEKTFGFNNDLMKTMLEWILVIIPVMLYFPVTEILLKGQSVGKKIMQIRVVSMYGNEPSLSQHFIRWVFRLIESPLVIFFAGFGILSGASDIISVTAVISMLLFFTPLVVISRSSLRQRIGDIAAGTIIISIKEKASISDTIFRDIASTDYTVTFTQILRLSDKDLNKVKELLDRSLKNNDHVLAARVAQRIKEVLHIETEMEPMTFLETLLNDYNYLATRSA